MEDTAIVQKYTYQKCVGFDSINKKSLWEMEADFSDGTHRSFYGWLSEQENAHDYYSLWTVVEND